MIPRYARANAPRHTPGQMNKAEAAYSERLEQGKLLGELHSWHFESLKLRLADKTFWTPDFLVLAEDGVLELHEVKGYMQDDAAVKIKVAAEMYPYFRVFIAWAKRERGAYVFRKELVR